MFLKSLSPTHCIIAGMLMLISCSSEDTPRPKPEIILNPYNIHHESISGKVIGINAFDNNLAVYVSLNDEWFSVPGVQNQLIYLKEDASWNCQMGNYIGQPVDKISIYLIPKGYQPPLLSGENLIPVKLNLIAPARKSIIL